MKRDAIACCTLTILVIAFFFRLFWPEPLLLVTPDFGRSDAWHFTFVTKYLLGKSLQSGMLPLWIPELGAGFPLLAEGQTGTFFLPNLILFRLFDPVTTYNVSIVFAILTLGWGMYVWLRLMKFQIFPALFGSITLAFSGMILAQLPHGALLQGVSLLPWVMACTLLLFQKKSRYAMVLWSFIFSQQLLTGFPQAAFITLLFAAGYGAWLLIGSSTKATDSIRFFVSFIAALGLSAIQILPSWEFLTQTTVARGITPDTASYFSYPLKHLLTLANPFALGNPKFGTYPSFFNFDGSIFWENVGGIGYIQIVFFFVHLTRRVRVNLHLFFFLATIISFLLILGKYSPLYLIYSFWPFHLFRVPSRFIWIFIMSIIILATRGIDTLWQQKRMQKILRLTIVILATVNTIILFTTWYSYHALEPASAWLHPPKILSSLPKEANVLTVGAEAVHNRSFLTSGWQTVEPYRVLRESLAPNSNAIWKIASSAVYAGRFLRRPSLFDDMLAAGLMNDNNEATLSGLGKKFLDLSGVNTIITVIPLSQTGTSRLTNNIMQDNITVWNNPTALPRAYLATHTILATTKEEAFAAISRDDFIPGKSIVVEKPLANSFHPKETATGRVRLTQQTETSLTVVVENNDSDAVLVLTDTYYPGWLASLDGKRVPILPTNIKQRGVVVPPGNHEVRFFYAPKSLAEGTVVSLLSIVFLFIAVVFPLPSSKTRIDQTTSLPLPHRRRSRGL